MPQALRYINPNDVEREKLGGTQEREERSREYEKNRKYYEGKHPEWLTQEMDDPINDNITINITKTAVDRTASFLFPEMPLFQIDLNQDTDEETWLNDAWLINGGAYFLSVIAQNGALSGHNYIKVVPRANDYPRLIAINPIVPITYWKADDPETVLWHELRWLIGRDETIQDIVNEDGKWVIHEYRHKVGHKRWTEDLTKLVMWNSDIPPMIAWPHLPNPNNYYGLAEVTDTTRDLNDDINRVASDIGKILRYHASPRTIATGTNESKVIPNAINGLFTIEDPNAKVYNLEMQSDLSSSMAFLTYLNDAYLTLTRVVVMKGTVKDFQRVTNTGIQAVFIDMIAKNNLLRWTYGRGLQKICQALLFVGKKALDVIPTVTWPDPLPSDPLETVNRLVIEQANGWNNPKTISQSLGYEWGVNVKNWNEVVKYEWITQGKGAGALGKAPNSNSSLNDQNLNTGN